jgi:hypothetical protein
LFLKKKRGISDNVVLQSHQTYSIIVSFGW